MTIYSTTFRIGDKRFEASAGTKLGVRRQMRRAAESLGATVSDIREVKWFGDTTTSSRGRQPDFVIFNESLLLQPVH